MFAMHGTQSSLPSYCCDFLCTFLLYSVVNIIDIQIAFDKFGQLIFVPCFYLWCLQHLFHSAAVCSTLSGRSQRVLYRGRLSVFHLKNLLKMTGCSNLWTSAKCSIIIPIQLWSSSPASFHSSSALKFTGSSNSIRCVLSDDQTEAEFTPNVD